MIAPFVLGPPKPKDDWSSNPGTGGGNNWGDPRGGGPQRDADLPNHVRNDRGGGWGGQPQRQQPGGGGGGNWGAPPPSAGGGGRAPGVWDHESPNMTRRPGMDDPSGTYHWGRDKPPGPPGSGKTFHLYNTIAASSFFAQCYLVVKKL